MRRGVPVSVKGTNGGVFTLVSLVVVVRVSIIVTFRWPILRPDTGLFVYTDYCLPDRLYRRRRTYVRYILSHPKHSCSESL